MKQMEYKLDPNSLILSAWFILLDIFSRISQSDISFAIAILVGLTTIIYNIVRIRKELKTKKNEHN